MSQFLRLHMTMQSAEYATYPSHVRRGIYVAYGTHLRVLLEFFVKERTGKAETRLRKKSDKTDIACANYWKEATVEQWEPADYDRWQQLSKLASHLGRGRFALGHIPPAGNPEDFRLVGCKILRALKVIRDAGTLFPETFRAANETMTRLSAEIELCDESRQKEELRPDDSTAA